MAEWTSTSPHLIRWPSGSVRHHFNRKVQTPLEPILLKIFSQFSIQIRCICFIRAYNDSCVQCTVLNSAGLYTNYLCLVHKGTRIQAMLTGAALNRVISSNIAQLTLLCVSRVEMSAYRKLSILRAAAASAQFFLLVGYSLPVSSCLTLQLMISIDSLAKLNLTSLLSMLLEIWPSMTK